MTRMQRRIAKIRAIKKTAKTILNSSCSIYTKRIQLINSLTSLNKFIKNKKRKVWVPAVLTKRFLDSELKRLQRL
jgi:hypothetical protein